MVKPLNASVKAGSIETIADSYGLGKSTIRRAIREGKLKPTRCGRRVLVRIADMEAFLDRESKEKE
jgi:excisionase family DNA binding protein